jgi:hypothetical protein
MLLDRFMPLYDFKEVDCITVAATPDRVFQAIKAVTPAEVPFFRLAFGPRTLPARKGGRPEQSWRSSRWLVGGKGATPTAGTLWSVNGAS